MNTDIALWRLVLRKNPQCLPYLSGTARWIARMSGPYTEGEAKTEAAFARSLYNRIVELYHGDIDTNGFLDAVSGLIQQQLTRAFRQALRDNEMDPDLVNQDGEGFKDELEAMILDEYPFVDGLAADVVQAAKDGAEVRSFQARAELYANRYNDAYNTAVMVIAQQMGGKLKWVYGDTEHCETCAGLNGIIAYAKEWERAMVRPQNPPNGQLECGGWRCQCRLEVTDERRSPNAYDRIITVVLGNP